MLLSDPTAACPTIADTVGVYVFCLVRHTPATTHAPRSSYNILYIYNIQYVLTYTYICICMCVCVVGE